MPEEKKILVIEDSYIVRFEVRQALDGCGLQIMELDNAEEFFRFSKRYDDLSLLILDISLPGMDGLTALEKMRNDGRWAGLPVIMLTGRADRQTVGRALQAGAADYIRKPFSAGELKEKVLPVLEAKTYTKMWPDPELIAQIRAEIKRGVRSQTPFSLIGILVPDHLKAGSSWDDYTELQTRIRRELDEIDLMFETPGRNLIIILPAADSDAAAKTAQKISVDGLESELEITIITFPDGSKSEYELLKKITARLKE